MESLEVLKLVDAGFTADEIRQMMNNPQNPQVFPQDEKANIPEQVTENHSENGAEKQLSDLPKVSDPAGYKAENTNNPDFNQLNATLEKLIRTIQVSNLHTNTVNSPDTQVDIEKQVDSIMAGIIRPEHEKKGE